MNDTPGEHSLDLVGVGKAMKAIPPEGWKRLVDTASSTFEAVLAPITETAAGLGKLIGAKFDRLIDVEKVLAAEAVATAKRKARDSGKKHKSPRPQILLQVIEHTATEADTGIRELWSNLLANEMVGVSVHPEVGRVLSRMSTEDAQILSTIAQGKPNSYTRLFAEAIAIVVRISSHDIPFIGIIPDPKTFNHAHMQNLGLIEYKEREWHLSIFGEGFIRAVTDPSIPESNSA